MSHDEIPPPSDDSLMPEFSHDIDNTANGNGIWRFAAVVGVFAALLIAASDSFPLEPRQGRLFLFAACIAIAAWLVLHFVFPGPWQHFRRQLDLLVPIGIVAGVEQLLAVLARMPLLRSIFEPDWTLSLVSLSLNVSLGTVATVIVWTAFAAWQTDLLWRALQDDGPLRLSPLRPIRCHFLRSLAALSLGVGVLLLALIPILAIGAVMFVVAIPLILTLGVVWNLATAALLPITLFKSAPLAESLKYGLHLSWRWKGRWWRLLFAQLLLLGLFVLLRINYTTSSTEYGPGPGQGRTTVNTVSSVKWQTNAFWVGGYEHGCRWYTKYAEALSVPTVPLISQLLALILLVVAGAMKMTVIRELVEDSEFSKAAKPSPLSPDPEPP